MLPKVTGVEVMKKIRTDPESGKVPVIVFSNTYLTNMVQEAWKAGATKCLSKANSSPKQVIDMVRNAIANNGMPGDVRPQPAKIVPGLKPVASASVSAPPPPLGDRARAGRNTGRHTCAGSSARNTCAGSNPSSQTCLSPNCSSHASNRAAISARNGTRILSGSRAGQDTRSSTTSGATTRHQPPRRRPHPQPHPRSQP